MTPEQAEARLFKKERQRIEGEIAMAEYEQRAQAMREKTARLRALRLAHEARQAKLARKPDASKPDAPSADAPRPAALKAGAAKTSAARTGAAKRAKSRAV
jgi:hypothetical protein